MQGCSLEPVDLSGHLETFLMDSTCGMFDVSAFLKMQLAGPVSAICPSLLPVPGWRLLLHVAKMSAPKCILLSVLVMQMPAPETD